MDEVGVLRRENQRLKEAMERTRRQRDEAEKQLARSQLRVAELESEVRKQANRISDLGGDNKGDVKASPDSKPKPKLVSILPSNTIEISDDEEERQSLKCSDGLKDKAMHVRKEHVSSSTTPATSSRLTKEDPGISQESGLPGRTKRPRSESPPIEKALSTSRDSSATRLSPDTKPSIKRQKPQPPNSKLKIKKEAFTLPQAVIDEYLRDTLSLAIVPPPLDELYVPRKFLRIKYGGSDMQFIARFSLENRGRTAVFPEPTFNPFVPTNPGAPGLIFASRYEITDGRSWAVFCKDKPSGEAVWRYMGDYESEVCGHPTPEQFQAQTSEVKQTWGTYIHGTKKWDVYVAMRARIAMRKGSHDMADGALEHEMERIRKSKGLPVTVEDIIAALERGEEWIDIIKMKCVSYDHDFAAEMTRRFDEWNAPLHCTSTMSKTVTRATNRRRVASSSRCTRITSSPAESDSDFSA